METVIKDVTTEEVLLVTASQSKSQRLWALLRQNTVKVGSFAEKVILPKNERSLKTKPSVKIVASDVESQVTLEGQSLQRPVQKFPFFMVLLSCVQVMLFYLGGKWWWLALGYDPHRRHEVWRFFTIMLVHSSGLQLWGNLIFQLIMGVLLEIVHHWKRIAIIYLASVLGGTLFISVLNPTVYDGNGASAGIYGLLFAHVATIIINWNQMDMKCIRVFWLVAYFAFDFGTRAYIIFGLKVEPHTNHAILIGGAVTGFLTSILVLKNFEKHPWEKIIQKICAGTLIALAVVIVLINIFVSRIYLTSEYNTNYKGSLMLRVYKKIDESPQDSELRKFCEGSPTCQVGLEQYKNGTEIMFTM